MDTSISHPLATRDNASCTNEVQEGEGGKLLLEMEMEGGVWTVQRKPLT